MFCDFSNGLVIYFLIEILICVFGNGFSHFCFAQSFVILVIKEGDPNMRFYHSGLGLVSSNK